MSIVLANPTPGTVSPPSGLAVLVLYRDPNTGNQNRTRAMYLRHGFLEAPDANEWETDDSWWDWIDEEPYWPEGWYEATASDPHLFPLPASSVICWAELPTFAFGGGEQPGDWYCERCAEAVPPEEVTYEETHDGCGGICQ